MRKFKFSNNNKSTIIILCILFLFVLIIPLLFNAYWLRIFTLTLIYLIVSIGLNVLTGYTGQFSLGHAGFFAVGAYTSAILYSKCGISFWVVLPISIIAGIMFGLIVGFPAQRAKGHMLALLTAGFGVIIQTLIREWHTLTGGPIGLAVNFIKIGNYTFNDVGNYYLILFICIIILWITKNLIYSKFGRAFQSLRDNSLAAECMGVNKLTYSLLSFVYSAALASLAGCLFTFFQGYISPEIFGFSLSVFFLTTVIVGGIGTLLGPIIGTIIMTILPESISFLSSYKLILYGSIMILVVLLFPQGIVGQLKSKLSLFCFELDKPKGISPNGIKQKVKNNSEVLVKIDDVDKKFGGLYALKGVSINILSGKVHSLIGPNGAGKSTLINVISGVYSPDRGMVKMSNNVISGKAPHVVSLFGIGRTFQNVQIFKGLTVLDNVLIGAHNKLNMNIFDALLDTKKAKREEQVQIEKAWRILKEVGLEDKAPVLPDLLSTGQQKLLEIARILAMEPNLILLDEPTAGLSESENKELIGLIKKIINHGITVFLIAHDMNFVNEISDNVTVLDFGKKIAEGTPQEIKNNQKVIEAYIGKQED